MKRKKNAYTLLLGIFLLAGCIDRYEAEPEVLSGLTVVNSFYEAQAVLHRLDAGSGLRPLGQGQLYPSIDFFVVPSCDDCKLEIISSNESAQLVNTTFAMQENRYYTSFVFGTEESPLHFHTDDKMPEGADNPTAVAGLRFFNLANTSLRATLHIAEAEPIAVFRDRPTETPETGKDAEQFISTTQTGTHVLTIRDEAGEVLARRPGVALDPGDYLTVFLTGDEGDVAPFYIGIVRHRGVN